MPTARAPERGRRSSRRSCSARNGLGGRALGDVAGHERGVAHQLGLDAPDRLERSVEIPHLVLPGPLPAGQQGREARGVADHRPLAPDRVRAVDRHLGRPTLRRAQLGEVREDDRVGGGAGQIAPALLGLAVEALALEAREQHRALGAGAALVLDRVAEAHERALGQQIGQQVRPPPPQAGVDRVVVG